MKVKRHGDVEFFLYDCQFFDQALTLNLRSNSKVLALLAGGQVEEVSNANGHVYFNFFAGSLMSALLK